MRLQERFTSSVNLAASLQPQQQPELERVLIHGWPLEPEEHMGERVQLKRGHRAKGCLQVSTQSSSLANLILQEPVRR